MVPLQWLSSCAYRASTSWVVFCRSFLLTSLPCGLLLQVDASQLNVAYSNLLAALFFSSPSAPPSAAELQCGSPSKSGTASGDGSGKDSPYPDLELCTRVVVAWHSRMAEAGWLPEPKTPAAAEAAAAVQMVGQLQYKSGELCTAMA